ncbi:MAG TPA: RtcB family protein [Anaerolineae bacterium]|nr:RtcB family protein [Anaerolineae bacterium]HQK15723.1 RtcB family protein [Anaerolineae bacterium]
MVSKDDFVRINDYVWELPQAFDGRMRVPARIYGNEEVFEMAFRDQSVEQLMNVAMLPGIVKYAMAMPDVHQGYGFPIGGVAAFRYDEGIISPGGVGYDINCGVRMLASSMDYASIEPYLKDITTAIFRTCPSGVGGKGAVQVSDKELDAVLEQGAEWAIAKGYGTRDDLQRTESYGRIAGANAGAVDARAKERGRPQLGSLGAGNHFLEIDVVDEIYDPAIAEAFGLMRDCVVVQIHCGSRGLGHEVCGQYLHVLQDAPRKYGINIPDRELVAAPVDSREGRDYLAAMTAAANYAFANRQILAHFVRRAFEQVLAGKVRDWHLHQVYDVAHNIAKIEEHQVGTQRLKVVVHRKGATRAFPPRHPDLPGVYRETGQPVLVPGSMGTASYVLVGTESAMENTFGSTCHGAGRMMSRNAALKQMRGEQVRAELSQQGIVVRTDSVKGLAEEAPYAYKDVSIVVDSVVGAGIARQVARVRPLAVIKG